MIASNVIGSGFDGGVEEMEKMSVELYELSLRHIIRFYIREAMRKKDWELVAVDSNRDRVVLKRYELKKE